MRRLIVSSALALACGLTAAAGVASAVAPAQPPRSHLRGFVCQHAMDPPARAMSVTAVMRPLPGTARMAMRFELRRRRRGARAVSVSGRDLNSWITPTNPPTLGQLPGDVWVVHHPVVDLAAPDVYRFRVTFRWTGASDKVLGTIVRVSQICAQPELRPDLAVPGLTVFPLAAGWDRYRVLVRNNGKTAAGPFDVQLSVGQPPSQQVFNQQVQGLDPRSGIVLRFRAPACTAGEPIMVTADPSGAVDDSNRANNTLATACPSG